MDDAGNIWVTEGSPAADARGELGFSMPIGHQMFKLNQDAEVLMTL